jgi:hypothetical protein
MEMSARITEILERFLHGSEWLVSDYDSDIDIAGPKQYLITTGAKKTKLTIRVKGPAAATVALNKTVVLGTGGSVSAGTAIDSAARDQASTLTPLVVIAKDYILGSSGQSAGAAIVTEYHRANDETVIKFKLKASTIYGLIFTTIADNNSASFTFEIDE